MYKYTYRGVTYTDWYKCKAQIKNVSFPEEEDLTDELLAVHGIVRTLIVPTLDDVKERKIEQLKSERDNEEESPVTTDLGDFDFDVKARARITGAKDVLRGTENKIEWTLADNTTFEVGFAELKNVTDIAAVRCNALHLKYRDLRDLVNSCTNIRDVEKISWDVINQQ